MRLAAKQFFWILFCLIAPSYSWGLSPMWGYISLVAGAGDLGFQDGDFYSALFNKPVGLALDSEKSRLFVSDYDNHCVRVIYLEEQNKVQTLAGTGKAGYLDGNFQSALFNHPTLIQFLSPDRLLVYDSDNKLFRILDLNSKRVSTLPGSIDPKDAGLWEGVFGMVFHPGENALYFTQPKLHAFKKVNLASGSIQTILSSPQLPNPGALCLDQGKLIAADTNLPLVYLVNPAGGPATGDLTADYREIGKGNNIIAMAASGTGLYALQSGDWPWIRIRPNPGPVTLMSPWGDLLEKNSQKLNELLQFNSTTPVAGFLADPVQTGSFYFGLPTLNCVMNLKDYEFEAYKNAERVNDNGLLDFSYPPAKPPHAFRILMSGDSHFFYQEEVGRDLEKRWPWGFNRMEMIPKKLELFLNTWASLNNEDSHYEVLNVSNYRYSPLFLWPYFSDPPLIQKFDVDLVLLFLTNDFEINGCFERPYSPEGVPIMNKDDPEFLQKTIAQRLKQDNDKILSDFYQRCVDLHYVTPGKEDFVGFVQMLTDPQLRQGLLEITQKPLRLLAEKIKKMKTSAGNPIPFEILYFPNGNRGGNPQIPVETYRIFWKEACHKAGIPFHDLSDQLVSTRLSYFPITEVGGNHHFDHNGHLYFSMLLAQELMKEKLIPSGLGKKEKSVKDR